MDKPARMRYAPSPTGRPHIGNIRTAIYDWLYARHTGGQFILRIEDTDRARLVEGALENILESLRWLGCDWDEGPEVDGPHVPYFQSLRLHLYQKAADELIEKGWAYKCYCTSERLEEQRRAQTARKEPPRYDRLCRDLGPEERAKMEEAGTPHVIRFKMPLTGQTSFVDVLRGEITFENAVLDDHVLVKSDGFPTYQLAVVVDDHYMEVTHVLRGEEWISSTPRHILTYKALGWEVPEHVHISLILGKDRSKLSKRHGAVDVLTYREQGYLPEALFNYLTLLGWSLDDKTEIMSREDLVKYFDITRISHTSSIFNMDKLDWMNGMYIRALEPEDLAGRVLPFLDRGLPPSVPRPISREYLVTIVPHIQERIKKLDEIVELTDFFFIEHLEYDPLLLVAKGLTVAASHGALQAASDRLVGLAEWNHESLEGALRPLAGELEVKTGQLFGILRVATTGRTVAPPLFETMLVLGRERTMARIDQAIALLQQGVDLEKGRFEAIQNEEPDK
ncbi:MAG: glutamate--tRNA ligase [Dehalococcoidia bacterium]|nr:glutamate--tRNA ligase [Dehalococcoidia bacterium]